MFSHACVCPTFGGGGQLMEVPSQQGVPPFFLYPFPGPDRNPRSRWGYLILSDRGYPHPSWWGGTPSQVQIEGTPFPGLDGRTLSQVQTGGTPPPALGRGTPTLTLEEIPSQPPPPPTQTWEGGTPTLTWEGSTPQPGPGKVPPPPPQSWPGTCTGRVPQLEQHSMYLLHGGRYPSCVQAGGLSSIYLI